MDLKNNCLDKINEFKELVTEFIKTDDISYSKSEEIELRYVELAKTLLENREIPDSVKKYITTPDENACPKEYSKLTSYNDFHKHITKIYTEKINQETKNKNEEAVLRLLGESISLNTKNTVIAEKLASRYNKLEMYESLIKLYRTMFVYNVNPKYFEKIGDLYAKLENFQEAIDYYLNYCESTKPTPKIYYKLAEVFEKSNDFENKNTCLNFARKLEEENGL